MFRLLAALLIMLALLLPQARAERTPLLRVDLKTGKRQRIDRTEPRDPLDDQLDALLDDSTGKRFSTSDLEQVERALRRFLRSRRPRSSPRLLLFLYPGRITRARLKELREVVVDVDLLVDPCPRSVCRDSLGKHLDLLGRALGKPTLRAGAYAIRFGTVSLRAKGDGRGQPDQSFSFGAKAVVKAAGHGGGRALIKSALAESARYGRTMATAVTRRARARGARLSRQASIVRSKGSVSVTLTMASDRVRYRTHVLAALLGTMQALRQSKITPRDVRLLVVAQGARRRGKESRFRCKGYPLAMHLDGRLSQRELWSTYILEEQRGGQHLSFDDDATTSAGSGAQDAPDRTDEILAENFNLLAPCLQKEAARQRSFRGVTLKFSVDTSGRATHLRLKERKASARLKKCLAGALARIRFQRHAGPPRQVTYPMYIRR